MTKINKIIVPAPAIYDKYCNKTSKSNDIIIMSICIHFLSCPFLTASSPPFPNLQEHDVIRSLSFRFTFLGN